MATKCWSQVKGRRLRVTRVDNLGRPVYGVCSTVVGGFVTVNVTSEVEEGAEQTVTAADGTICFSDKADDQLKWLNVEMTFCNVDPDLMLMVNPLFKRVTDYKGDTVGVEESYSYSSTEGIALEVWMDTANVENTDRYAQGSWLYYLIPYISGGTIGDEEISGSALNLTLRGRTRKGSNWGVGPYNDIRLHPSPIPGGIPVPGPLLMPFSPNAPRRRELVELRPPEPKCGCQPLTAPDGPTVSINEVTTNPSNRSTISVQVATAGAYRVDFGDGSAPQDLPQAGLTHAYTTPGTYPVQVWLTANPQKVTIQLVTVPFTGPLTPELVVLEDTTDPGTRRNVRVLVDNHGSGSVVLDWGDGTPNTVNPGDGTTPTTHLYNRDGTFQITATDQDDASRKKIQTVRVPFGLLKPTLTVTEDLADANRRSVNVTVDNHGNGPVVLEWGDNQQNSTNPGDGTTVSHHSYLVNGTYTIKATDTDDATATASTEVEIPFGNVEPTITVTELTTDPNRMSVSVKVDNHGNGPVSLTWGQAGSVTDVNPGDAATATNHVYTEDGTFTITATDQNNPALTASTPVTVPYGGGLPMTMSVVESTPPGSPRRKVTAQWDNKGQGPVKIDWGDGSAIADGAMSGSLDHTYAADGTFTVTVTDATTAARTESEDVTVPFTTGVLAEPEEGTTPDDTTQDPTTTDTDPAETEATEKPATTKRKR